MGLLALYAAQLALETFNYFWDEKIVRDELAAPVARLVKSGHGRRGYSLH